MKTVVFTSQSFGFGPTAKLLAIAAKVSGVRKVFFGAEVAHDFAWLHSFDEIHYVKQEDSEEVIRLLERADLLVNVMEFALAPLAKFVGCPHFLVDSLLWFWPSLPQGTKDADIYFCQEFFGAVAEKIDKHHLKNATTIGPIVGDDFPRLARKDQAIVNFGGIENPYVEIGKNSDYPFVMLKLLLPILGKHFSQILVTGRERVLAMCRDRFLTSDSLRFAMLDYQTMLAELSRSRVLFTAPGIQTIYDAYDKLPIFCLPPQNNSNARNLDTFVANGVTEHYLQWDDLYECDFRSKETEAEQISSILAQLRLFENSECDQHVLRRRLEKFLDEQHRWPDLLCHQQHAMHRWGSNGVDAVVNAIEQFLYKTPATSALHI